MKNITSSDSKLVLIFDLDDTLYQKHNIIVDDGSGIENIQLFHGVREMLERFHHRDILVFLVTKGEEELQNRKIELLQIRNLFTQIFICAEKEGKRICFSQIKNEYPNHQIIVIGDKLNEEIYYGNELNMLTIRLKQGKYANLNPICALEIPTYELTELIQLESILKPEVK